jgi:hypothetical protein
MDVIKTRLQLDKAKQYTGEEIFLCIVPCLRQ